MSKGIAQKFKQAFPPMYEAYHALCQADNFDIGKLLLYKGGEKWVLNFPIKKHPNAKARLESIEAGLQKFASVYADEQFASVSFPALGVDDGLTWDEVRPLMESYLRPLPIMVYIHIDKDPYAEPLRADVLAKRLNGQTQDVTFEAFWRNIVNLARKTPQHHTLGDTPKPFSVAVRDEGKRRISLSLLPEGGESHFLPQSVLKDLWQYVLMTGYSLPQNLPDGLDSVGDMVVSFLSKLDYLRPIIIQPDGGDKVIGLHYVPPISRGDSVAVTLEPA